MLLDYWFVLLGFVVGVTLCVAVGWKRAPRDKPADDDLLDALEFAEAALVDAATSEDGLDGGDAMRVAQLCSDALRKHGRRSKLWECGQGPVV